jgi:hypothetical protein
MLFATLDPTTRRIRLPRSTSSGAGSGNGNTGSEIHAGGGEEEGEAVLDANAAGARNKVLPASDAPVDVLLLLPATTDILLPALCIITAGLVLCVYLMMIGPGGVADGHGGLHFQAAHRPHRRLPRHARGGAPAITLSNRPACYHAIHGAHSSALDFAL